MTLDAATLARFAPAFAIISASAWLVALITIGLFFAVGQPWGTINDVASLVQWVAAVPLVLVIYQAQRVQGTMALPVAAIGLASLVVASALTVLLLAQVLTFQQQGIPTAVAGGVFGLWLVLAAALWAGGSPLPTPLVVLMAVAGLGTAAGVGGFIAFGPSHWLTTAGGLVGGLAYPVWAYWLAILLLRTPDLLTRSH